MNTLTLKDFITQTIIDVIDGTVEAQKHAQEVGGWVNPAWVETDVRGQLRRVGTGRAVLTAIDFDVAVTVGQDDKEEGKIGVFAAVIGAGVKGENVDRSETVSRIKFQILAELPTQKQ